MLCLARLPLRARPRRHSDLQGHSRRSRGAVQYVPEQQCLILHLFIEGGGRHPPKPNKSGSRQNTSRRASFTQRLTWRCGVDSPSRHCRNPGRTNRPVGAVDAHGPVQEGTCIHDLEKNKAKLTRQRHHTSDRARNTPNAFFGGPRARQCFLSVNLPATQCVVCVFGTNFVKPKHTKRPNLTLQSSACLRVLFPGTFGLCGCAGNAPKTASDLTVTARVTLSSSFLLARLRARSSFT